MSTRRTKPNGWLTVELHTSEYRGDHTAEIVIALSQPAAERLEHYAARVLAPEPPDAYIVLRAKQRVAEEEGGE